MIEQQLFPMPATKKGGNTTLGYARKKKRDEFYTRALDIERELPNYAHYLKGKHVFCNCDDPAMSQFWDVLQAKFHAFGLKRLTAICYAPLQNSTRWEYDGKEITWHELRGNGDFRSPESIEVLEQCDVVITNPPFSLFRMHMYQLLEHDKKFLVIANLNTFMGQQFFPYFARNEIRLGVTARVKGMNFYIPKEYHMDNQEPKFDESGRRIVQISTVRWFTNIEHGFEPDGIDCHSVYNPDDYPVYTNYANGAVEVSKTKLIPSKESYQGLMGVPITFLDHHRHDQFDLVDIWNGAKVLTLPDKALYTRLIVAHKGTGYSLDMVDPKRKQERVDPTLI